MELWKIMKNNVKRLELFKKRMIDTLRFLWTPFMYFFEDLYQSYLVREWIKEYLRKKRGNEYESNN